MASRRERLRAQLDRFEFGANLAPFNPRFEIEGSVRKGRKAIVTVAMDFVGVQSNEVTTFRRKTSIDPEREAPELAAQLRELVIAMFVHEADEGFFLDGVCVKFPHGPAGVSVL